MKKSNEKEDGREQRRWEREQERTNRRRLGERTTKRERTKLMMDSNEERTRGRRAQETTQFYLSTSRAVTAVR